MLALACWDVINVINLVSSLLSNLARHSSLGSKQACLHLRLIPNNSGKAERYAIHDQLFGFRLSFKLLHKHSVLGVKQINLVRVGSRKIRFKNLIPKRIAWCKNSLVCWVLQLLRLLFVSLLLQLEFDVRVFAFHMLRNRLLSPPLFFLFEVVQFIIHRENLQRLRRLVLEPGYHPLFEGGVVNRSMRNTSMPKCALLITLMGIDILGVLSVIVQAFGDRKQFSGMTELLFNAKFLNDWHWLLELEVAAKFQFISNDLLRKVLVTALGLPLAAPSVLPQC